MIPKQIIYPLRYVRPLFRRDAEAQEELFLKKFSDLLRLPQTCVPLGRARAGFYLLTKAAVTEGRPLVLLSAYTIPDVVKMIRFAGGTPVFVDHEPRSTNIDVNQLQDYLSDRVACAWITHYHVNQARVADIRSLCSAKGVRLFEDCAIALGATVDGESVGLQSDGAVFSLSAYKFLNYFWGGAIVTCDSELRRAVAETVSGWTRFRASDYSTQIVRALKYDMATRPVLFDYVAAPLLRRRQRRSRASLELSRPRTESTAFDRSLQSRPSAGAFAEWNRKMQYVNGQLEHRRQIASTYQQTLGEMMVSQETPNQLRNGSCFVNYPVWVDEKRRDEIYKRMLFSRFDVGLSLYPNVHNCDEFKLSEGRSCNVTQLCNSVISLPTHPRVSVAYAEKLANALKAILEHERSEDRRNEVVASARCK